MALTAYRTWVAGEVVTAALLNAQIRDNGNWLNLAHGARVHLTSDTSMTSGTVYSMGGAEDSSTALGTWTVDDDTDSFRSSARLVVPTGLAGVYAMMASFSTASSSAASRRSAAIRHSSNSGSSWTTRAQMNLAGMTATSQQVVNTINTHYRLAVGDCIILGQLLQDTGGPLNAQATAQGGCYLSIYLVGA